MSYILFEDFMGDLDDLAEVNLIGPFPDDGARIRELARLDALPLGAPEFNGGYRFHLAGYRPREVDCMVSPDVVAGATTIREFFHLFHGLPEEVTETENDIHPDQAALPL